MKKAVAWGMLLCLLLCGCEKKNDVSNIVGEDTTSQTEQNNEMPFNPDDTGGQSDARLEYYEQLVIELREELLNMKTALYVSRVEYESRIAELEAGKSTSTDEGNSQTQPDPETESEKMPLVTSDFQYTVKNGAATLTAYVGNSKMVTVPSRLGGYPVVAIGDRAFLDHSGLTSVILPDTVTQIGWFAFSGCVSLQSITIPQTVEAIFYGAFQNCPSTLTVSCVVGSYAEQYARSYGITIKQ